MATVHKTARIVADASDDHGLAQAWLIYQVDDQPEQRLPILDLAGVRKQQIEYAWKLADRLRATID